MHPKSKKEWFAKPIYEKKQYGYIHDLMQDEVSLRKSENEPLKGRKSSKADVELNDNIARAEKSDKSQVVKQYRQE